MALSSNGQDWKQKYAGIRRKYEELYEETFKLSEQLYESRSEVEKLKSEKKLLLDTIKSRESGGYRGMKYKKPQKERSEAAKVLQALALKMKQSKAPKPIENRPVQVDFDLMMEVDAETPIDTAVKSTTPADADPATLCIAVLGPGRSCKKKRQGDSMYCWRHAPLDPNSGSTFCLYTDTDSHKKCTNPIPKNKKPLLCAHHIAKVSMFIGNATVMNGASDAEVSAILAQSAPK